MKYSILLCIFLCLFSFTVKSQTDNDNIEQRIRVFPDSTIHSITNGNTVEWNCVDEKLTGKCIKYHNDQWFFFTALNSPLQYLNITGQDCRDLWGIQIVVIEGTPCQTETYTIITCVSLATQDDIFVPLKYLRPGTEYLLNIDGYLHDYCSFEMELSLKPKGLPVVKEIQVEGWNKVKTDTVFYNWQTPDSLLNSIRRYELLRRKALETKFSHRESFVTKTDAYGQAKTHFQFTEVITDDDTPWTYKLVAETDGPPLVVDEFKAYPDWRAKLKSKNRIWVELDFEEEAAVNLQLIDYLTGQVLEELPFDYNPKTNYRASFNFDEWIKAGLKRFQIIARNRDTNEVKRFDFEYVNYKVERMR